MDITGADYFRAVGMIKDRLKAHPVPIQLPIGKEDNFLGMVDLVNMNAEVYHDDLGEKIEIVDIPDDMKDLANEYGTSTIFFMGFIDGINESLVNPIDLESVEENTELNLAIDFEKLYFNMLDAKADYLYSLPQWEAIFSPEKRKEIHSQWKDSKTVVNHNKIGRNDACPCGSGKKYKKCCGKN